MESLRAKDGTIEKQQDSMNALITKMDTIIANPIGGAGAGALAIRKDKAASVYQNLQKSQKFREILIRLVLKI